MTSNNDALKQKMAQTIIYLYIYLVRMNANHAS